MSKAGVARAARAIKAREPGGELSAGGTLALLQDRIGAKVIETVNGWPTGSFGAEANAASREATR